MTPMALVMMTMLLWGGAVALSSQQSTCTNALVGLAPCLGYLIGLVTVPSSPCCKQLSSIVDSQPQCLCQIVSGNSGPVGVPINKAQALALPGACNVETPPISLCNIINHPTGTGNTDSSTTVSPSSTPNHDSSETAQSSNTTTTTTPSTISGRTTESVSNGNITKFPNHLTLFLVSITSTALVVFRVV